MQIALTNDLQYINHIACDTEWHMIINMFNSKDE